MRLLAAAVALGTSLSPAAVDPGAGRVVLQPDATTLRVVDRDAAPRSVALPAGCAPAGVRGDVVTLRDCEAQTLDLATGAVATVAPGLVAAGSAWVELPGANFRALADGRLEADGPQHARDVPDLNSPTLWERMCAPLRRVRDRGEDAATPFLPYGYSPPLGLRYQPYPYRALKVERCGRERPLRLSRCRAGCSGARLGAGGIAWLEGDRIRFWRAGERRSWRRARFGRVAAVVPTRRHVVVSAGRPGGYTVYLTTSFML